MPDSFEFEIIPTSEIVSNPRGRKSKADPKLVEALKGLKAGQAIRVNALTLDPKSADYGKDKARVSATLRSAVRSAGHAKFSILFSPTGTPQVKLG